MDLLKRWRVSMKGVEITTVPIGNLITRKKKKCGLEKAEVYSVTKEKGFVLSDSLHDFSIYSEDTSNYSIVNKNDFAYNPSRLNIGSFALFDKEIGKISPMYVVFSCDTEKISPMYLYYYVKSPKILNIIDSLKEVGARFRFDFTKWGKIQIPLPHIKVQEEIVKILDSFTNLIDALNEELSLRQKQFEYYREKLLTFDDNTNMQKICNFATIQSGKNKERTDNGQFPLFGSTGLISRTNISVYEGDYILIARVGANAGFTYRVNGKFDVSDNTLIVTIIKNNTINIDYLYHCLIEQNLNKYAKGGGQPLVTSGELKNISIPIPSLAIQKSIVEKLDAFESLISSLKEEIALRQKQYEYYREKLLTFN